jgi:hypothetical protein
MIVSRVLAGRFFELANEKSRVDVPVIRNALEELRSSGVHSVPSASSRLSSLMAEFRSDISVPFVDFIITDSG